MPSVQSWTDGSVKQVLHHVYEQQCESRETSDINFTRRAMVNPKRKSYLLLPPILNSYSKNNKKISLKFTLHLSNLIFHMTSLSTWYINQETLAREQNRSIPLSQQGFLEYLTQLGRGAGEQDHQWLLVHRSSLSPPHCLCLAGGL